MAGVAREGLVWGLRQGRGSAKGLGQVQGMTRVWGSGLGVQG